jgi:threonine dehydrogenase-like Zn-dependent dehydrogenase
MVRAITLVPGRGGSAELSELVEPPGQGSVLVEAIALGVCGTDRDIVRGEYGSPPPGRERLVLGHESLGRVLDAPEDGTLARGDLVVGIVRRPDPVPCRCCAAGEWDMCRNGRYTERGIKELDGYGAERWRIEPAFAVKLAPALTRVGVLLEPTSVVAKAWEHIERIAARACVPARTALVTGAGPVGLLAALLGVQRGYDIHVHDHNRSGPKPDAVRSLGATYHATRPDASFRPDVIVECTGVDELVIDAIARSSVGGTVCLTGISTGGRTTEVDAGALNLRMVLENDVVFGTVNANRHHFEVAAAALAAADQAWLERLITRRVPLDRWPEALEREPGDIKVAVDFTL